MWRVGTGGFQQMSSANNEQECPADTAQSRLFGFFCPMSPMTSQLLLAPDVGAASFSAAYLSDQFGLDPDTLRVVSEQGLPAFSHYREGALVFLLNHKDRFRVSGTPLAISSRIREAAPKQPGTDETALNEILSYRSTGTLPQRLLNDRPDASEGAESKKKWKYKVRAFRKRAQAYELRQDEKGQPFLVRGVSHTTPLGEKAISRLPVLSSDEEVS